MWQLLVQDDWQHFSELWKLHGQNFDLINQFSLLGRLNAII